MSMTTATSNAMSNSRGGLSDFPISILLKGFNKYSLETWVFLVETQNM
jgi:hypothetical protein